MDNLTHSLVGAALARTRLGRLSPCATPALIVGANLPDLDIVVRLWAGRAGYLQYHRGVTHGILGVLLQAGLLACALRFFERRRARRLAVPDSGSAGSALLLSLAALASHPLLDYLNVYGLRPWLPFDASWVYGDALFIVDPWLWLLLGTAALLGGARTRAGSLAWSALFALGGLLIALSIEGGRAPRSLGLLWGGAALLLLSARWRGWGRAHGPALVRAAWGAAILYVGSQFVLGPRAERIGLEQFALRAAAGEHVLLSSASPMPLDPRHWTIFVASSSAVHLFEVQLGQGLRSHTRLERLEDDPRVLAARSAECTSAWRSFVRYPHAALMDTAAGTSVELMDARYQHHTTLGDGQAQGTWASVVVEIAPSGAAHCP